MNDQSPPPQARDSRPAAPLRPAPARRLAAPAPDLFEPRTLLRLLRREMWRIAFALVLALALAAWRLLAATPMWQAEATVVLDTREAQVVDIESVMSGLSADSSVVNTEVEVLRSRNLMDRVVARLDLESDPEFNPDLVAPGLVDRALGALRRALESGGAETLVPLLDAAPAPEAEDPAFRRRQTAIDRLLERLRVQNVPLSYVFVIRVQSESAQKSARIANTIADLYILDQLEAKFEATRRATSWLSERVADLQVDLEAAEEQVKDYSASTSLISEASLEASNRQMKELRERRAELDARVGEAGLLIERLGVLSEAVRRAPPGAPEADAARAEAAALLGDRRLEALAADLARPGGAGREAALAPRFDSMLAAAVERLARDRDRQAAQAEGIETSIGELEGRISEQSEDLVRLRQLQREAEASRLLYEYFLGRMKETSVQQGIQEADSRILSPAVAPLDPASPRKGLTLAIAAALGLIAGVGWAVARETLDDRVRGPEPLEAATGLKVMGVIPDAPSRRRGAALKLLVEKPSSALAEAVRNLRTSVLLSNVDRRPQVVMVTSSVPGEGKTTTTLMLAQNAAALGKRVLVMECDLRRRVFQAYFGLDEKTGLLSVLSGQASAEQAIRHDPVTGLDVLTGQRSRANAADVFSSERFAELMEELRDAYDFIFIDTPPVLAVPDARVIAGRADAVLYAVRWNATGKEMVKAGLDLFDQIGVRVTGLTLTQADPRGLARYGYAGYGYGYGYGAAAARKYYTT
ncbi:polysaccharide biosynthesis tyrosine autokinase [Albimonas sp. CAU 1670]|uniref:polysaccharide biosynthesis tyrosine autokinase n=1 Tax=Albimonas sp. CAU 1670 TaxID=3032599 RepID=UPI0023DA5164|nr:polysaccharide biosynthesis tyrosine autokinase [Albimonas sp. CAU 1670]MDF2233470.1 polysaccharide biosynthesis tyrosine autokinase [Albimonas sp. CAU 1670]